MKDAVKITVIATGFKDSGPRMRHLEVHPASAVARAFDDFPEPEREPESDSLPPPPPMVMEQAVPQPASLMSSPANGLDAVRNSMMASFEPTDLDVPAFLRKRSEPM